MIGRLPVSLRVDGVEYPINSDYRAALDIFEAFGDSSLSAFNKSLVMLEILYDFNVPPNTEAAQKQALWFLDVGVTDNAGKDKPKTMDYAQDEQPLFSAVNAVAGHDIRGDEYMHWWTFCGLCLAVPPDAPISHIVGLREKLARGERLDKWEKKFYSENRKLIDLKCKQVDYEEMMRALESR